MISPERALWAAVLARLIADARGDGDKLDQQRAKHVLRRGGRDLTMICDLAGFDAEAVMDRYERMNGRFVAPQRPVPARAAFVDHLARRRQRVAELRAAGHSRRHIAAILQISPEMVRRDLEFAARAAE